MRKGETLLLPGLENLLAGRHVPPCTADTAAWFPSNFLPVAQQNRSHATYLYPPSGEASSLLHILFDFWDFSQNSGISAVRTVPANIVVV